MLRLTSRALPALATALVTIAAVACADEADGSAVRGDSRSGTGRGTGSSGEAGDIAWEDCGGGGECGSLEVPLDYDDPDGETITLSIARAPATGERVGALFVNPGGPGATASDFALGMATQLPPEITERFDVVGVDPRGTGASEIDCGGDFAELYALDYSIDSPEDEEQLLDVSQEYVDGCEQAAGEMLPHLGTVDNARDIDAVREALGDDQLSFLGYSFGTALGQVYAQEFPDRVRAMVLDAVVELGPTGSELATEQARGFESALTAFAADCDADESCPLAPNSMDALDELSAMVEEQPIPAEPRALGPGDLAIGLAEPLYDERSWPALASAVADALDDDGTAMVGLADEYLAIASFDVYFAVNCIDFAWPDSPDELLADAVEATEDAPHFGEPIVNDYVRCPLWPVEGEPLEEVTAPGTPPILVVSTTNDPATPHQAGVNVAETLESGVLITYEGEGHGVSFGGESACVDDAATAYLVDLEAPEEDITC